MLLLPIIRCWCAVHLLWSTSPASPTWTSWATASIRDSPTKRCVTASGTINAFQPPLRIFWDRASWTIMCSLGREHFIPLTPQTCDHAIMALPYICQSYVLIYLVYYPKRNMILTRSSLFFCLPNVGFLLHTSWFLIWRGRYVVWNGSACHVVCSLSKTTDDISVDKQLGT